MPRLLIASVLTALALTTYAAAKAVGTPEAGVGRQLDPLVSWHEDLFLRGPTEYLIN